MHLTNKRNKKEKGKQNKGTEYVQDTQYVDV